MQPSQESPPQISAIESRQVPNQNNQLLREVQEQEEQELELEMLTEECEQLINKIFSTTIQVESPRQEQQQSLILKQDKVRLEKQFLDLCVQIERQQKELENYKFKIKVANKQADYYSRQIKEKEEILRNLQKHQQQQSTQRRKSFRK